jgi:hypothetical protein
MKKQLVNFINNICSILNKSESEILVTVYENSSQNTMRLEEFVNHYNPEDMSKGLCHLNFKVESSGKYIATFSLNDMYNCAGILVFSELIVAKSYRNLGVSRIITGFVSDFAKYYGYGLIQAIDLESNDYQKKSFLKNDWYVGNVFLNPKTGNRLNIWYHNLNES